MKKINQERQANGLSAISRAIQPFAKQLLGKKGFVEIDILINWEKIVGEELAEYSFPQKIDFKKNERNNGTLHLTVPSGAFAVEIKHREPFIIERINGYFGYNAVSNLKIIQNNNLSLDDIKTFHEENKDTSIVTKEEENYISELTDDIKNENLREILTKLGKSIINDNKQEK